MRNIIKTVLMVVITFYICSTPNKALWVLAIFGVFMLDFGGWVMRFSILVQILYCFINPLIYAINPFLPKLIQKISCSLMFQKWNTGQKWVNSGATCDTFF
jgi:hypothetical protein